MGSINALQRYTASDTMRLLSDEEERIGRMVFEKSFEIKKDEKVLIVCDPGKQEEAAVFFEYAKRYTSNLSCILFDGMTENSQEPVLATWSSAQYSGSLARSFVRG